MKKRILALVLTVILACTCFACFAGCKNDNTGKEFKVGVLHINPVSSTSGYTYAHQQGIEAMQAELGLKDSQIVIKDSIDDGDSSAINTAIEELIEQGCNMIIGTSFGYMEELQAYAEEYPNIIFSHGTGYLDTFGEGKNNNMNNYFGRIYQARYLSGIVAGLATTSDKIGYVSAFGTTIAECTSGVNAFALGVQAVNPDAEVYVKTLDSWYDPANEAAHAKTLIDMGCDVIAQHCDTEQPSVEAKKAGVYSIGYNSDMSKAIENGTDTVLTSVVWNWGVYYTAAVREAMKCFDNGEFKNNDAWTAFGNYYGSYADGLYDITELSSKANADTAAILELVKAEMKKGTTDWDVFTNKALSFAKENDTWTMTKVDRELKKADGTATGAITVANITGDMPYWIEGVTYVA